jgi:hypothetical protein
MEKVAVLPVPDWAWAITSLPDQNVRRYDFFFFSFQSEKNSPLMMGMMARCWMAEGRSKP